MEPPGNSGELLGRALWRRIRPVAGLIAFVIACTGLAFYFATSPV